MMFPDPSMSACPPTRIEMCETPAVARVLTAFNTSGDPMDSRCFAMSCSGFNFSSFARATGATERADASNSVKQNRPMNDLDDTMMPPCERRQCTESACSGNFYSGVQWSVMDFKLVSSYSPRGDQATAIEQLSRGL